MTSPDDDRQGRALELHLAGAGFEAIARSVGYGSAAEVRAAVIEALRDSNTADRDEAIETELARLDAMSTGLWPKARRGDVAAVDRILKIGERRSALLAARNQPTDEVSVVDELADRRRSGTEASGSPSRRRRSGGS